MLNKLFPFLSFPVLLYPQDSSEHNEGGKSTAKEEGEEEEAKQPMCSERAQWYPPFPHPLIHTSQISHDEG